MSQDTFNKLYTILLTAFFMGVFLYGLITGKTVNWEYIFGFIIPSANHVIHQIMGTQVKITTVKAQSQETVARIVKNGVVESGDVHS